MADIEKVIKGLENCKEGGSCDGCQYDFQSSRCIFHLHADALELLKELIDERHYHEEWKEGYGNNQPQIIRCKDCRHYKDGFCYNPNTYDDEKTRGNTVPDWFCADGERKPQN
jgi:hypothetical protein